MKRRLKVKSVKIKSLNPKMEWYDSLAPPGEVVSHSTTNLEGDKEQNDPLFLKN